MFLEKENFFFLIISFHWFVSVPISKQKAWMTSCDQQDHRIDHIGNVSRRSRVPRPAERRVSDGIRSDYSELCPVKS